jgi:hypothetical protein
MAVALTGCNFFGGGDEASTSQEEQAAPAETQQAADTTAQTEPAPQETAPQQTTPATRVERPSVQTTAMDEPWTPTHTGTVDPGMTRAQVVAVWGEPVTERTTGNWTFMHFRNGCEASCGTFDVVMLEGGQVVDAIVRGQGHAYSGVSSSPPNRVAEFTPPASGPGDTES